MSERFLRRLATHVERQQRCSRAEAMLRVRLLTDTDRQTLVRALLQGFHPWVPSMTPKAIASREWRISRRRRGLCLRCPNPVTRTSYCKDCSRKRNAVERELVGVVGLAHSVQKVKAA